MYAKALRTHLRRGASLELIAQSNPIQTTFASVESVLIAHHRALPFYELLALADQPPIETEATAPGGLVTFFVDVRHISSDSVRVDASSFGNNWFKLERLDESVVIQRNAGSEA
ncbi:hypothetical protein CEE69_05420 [Rhodopirellula bahusiensis]|uniref:Uncharacterized protein n=1 Tax=Rhodopirellula bahusiensis TaxID=2014065 RepID=A0A2G1WAR5_9BACT|nr:hypothetical protein CEE69_05420 [Rhodopirellula bahusiensis]